MNRMDIYKIMVETMLRELRDYNSSDINPMTVGVHMKDVFIELEKKGLLNIDDEE